MQTNGTEKTSRTHEVRDLTIIGAGPAGLFALFYAGMRGASAQIVDALPQPGGQLAALYPEKYIFDVAGFPKVLAKDLVADLVKQTAQFGAPIHLMQNVVGLEQTGDHFTLITETDRFPTRAIVIAAPLALLTWINVVGVKSGARTAVILSIAKVLPLIFLIVVGLPAIDAGALFPIPAPPRDVLGEAALLLLFAYAGFENTAAAAGEYENPKRDVPFALLTMIVVVTALYTAVQIVALGVLPDLADKVEGAPLADAAVLDEGSAESADLRRQAILALSGLAFD